MWWRRKPPLSGDALTLKPQSLDEDLEVDWEACTAGCPKTGDQYLVVGCGFLGCRIIHALVLRGEERIRAFDISGSRIRALVDSRPELYRGRVEIVEGDACNIKDVTQAATGVTAVFFTAASIRFWDGSLSSLPLTYNPNVVSIQTLVQAALRGTSVQRIIFTSTGMVVHPNGKPAFPSLDETAPYVDFGTALNNYALTKALGEQQVLSCSGLQNAAGDPLLTVAARACSALYGYNDNLITQKFLDSGSVVMFNENMILDYIYVDNFVLAQLKLEHTLRSGQCGGEAFNISNETVAREFEFYDCLRGAAGGMRLLTLPCFLLWCLAYSVQVLLMFRPQWLSFLGEANMLTPATLRTSGCDGYTFSTAKANNVLGYRPAFSLRQGLLRLLRERQAKKIIMSARRDV